MLGELPLAKALEIAEEKGLDLVEVSPDQNPPVCKIMSYSKFKYEESKKLRKAKAKGKTKDLKEIRFAPFIGPGDFDHKIKRIKEFLDKGHKVKVTVFFKGRGATPQVGEQLVEKILTALEEYSNIEQALKKQGRRWFFVVMPEKIKK